MTAQKGAKRAPPKPPIGRHRALLEIPAVRSWHESRSLRSRLSADQYVRQFGLILERTGLDPTKILDLARTDPDRLRDLLVQDAAKLKRAGRLDSYIAKYSEGLRAYFKFHHVAFDGYPPVSAIRGASLANERIPKPEELARVLERLSLRARVVCLLMAHSGVRPGVLGSYGGEDGLRLADLPELQLSKDRTFGENPFLIRVPAALSKTRRAYVTFGTSQLATALLAYLSARADGGEDLEPSSPVIAAAIMRGVAQKSRRDAKHSKGFLSTKAIVEEVRSTLKATVPEGVTWRPYVLRSYCSTRLLLAEGQGKISRDLRESILGHDGGIASRYNVGKRWGEELLLEARREYGNASEFLETTPQSRTNVAVEFRRTLLDVAGLSAEETTRHMTDSSDELIAILRAKLLGGDTPNTTPVVPNGGSTPPTPGVRKQQKAVSLKDAEQLLSEGWTFVTKFGPDRILLQAPTR